MLCGSPTEPHNLRHQPVLLLKPLDNLPAIMRLDLDTKRDQAHGNVNLSPRPGKDEGGLSFQLTVPTDDKYVKTTLGTVNKTGVLESEIDRPGHVAVNPKGKDSAAMASWTASREDAVNNPHPLTTVLKSLVIPVKKGEQL